MNACDGPRKLLIINLLNDWKREGDGEKTCCQVPRKVERLLERANRRSMVEIERKILIEEHSNVPRAGLHLLGRPG